MTTFVLKLDKIDNMKETITNIITSPDIISPNNFKIMSQSEYSNYILEQSGTLYKQKINNIVCSVCNKKSKQNQTMYKFKLCNHSFHNICVKKIYNCTNNLLSCPLCSSSTEELCSLDELTQ